MDEFPGATSATVKVDGVSLRYHERGAGPTIVLLHGWPQTSWAWRKVMQLLAENFRVIAFDCPGLGDSGPPTDGCGKRALARDVYKGFQALGLSKAHWVGHDLGAVIAYALARQFPQAVETLTVMDDPIPGLADWEVVKAKWPRWHFAFNALPQLPEKLVAGRELDFFGWFYGNAFQKDAISEADARRYAAAYSKPEALKTGFDYYRAFPLDAEENRLDTGRLTMPVLALGGEYSPWKTYLHDILADRCDRIEGEVVPACGHYIPEEQPVWLAQRLVHFIG